MPAHRFVPGLLLLLAVAFLLAGCDAEETAETQSAAEPQAVEVVEPEVEQETETVIAGESEGELFQNPVFRHDFPDPGVIEVDGVYYAYATNAAGRNVQVATSTDLVDWNLQHDGLPALPAWAQLGGSLVWAPEVIQIDDTFVLYFTARDKTSDRQCIGVAVSDEPGGPFQAVGEEAFICQANEGGSIDASPFRDEVGELYLYWKNDGNCCNMPTYLYVQRLADDGLGLIGDRIRLIRNDEPWEGQLVEAPTMWKHDGAYYLFYSANSYGGAKYAVGYALCESPLGPCSKAPENPILSSVFEEDFTVMGPGHQTIVLDDEGDTWFVYHAWEITSAGTRGSRRFMWIDRLVWEEGRPDVLGPSRERQPVP